MIRRFLTSLLVTCYASVSGVALQTGSQAGSSKQPAEKRQIRNEAPSVSPDGSRIAYISNKDGNDDLYVFSPDGTNEIRLTNTPDHESRPVWSPDGKHIWFSVFASDVSRLYAIDPDGRNLKQLGSVPGRAGGGLSPDGTRVLYSTGSWTAVRLFVSDLDGSHAHMLADTSSALWNVQWSPDGKRIAYTGRDAAGKPLSVWVMNADGSERHHVTHVAPGEGQAQLPAWSHDGRQLAIQVSDLDVARPNAQIWIVDLASGRARKLAHPQVCQDEIPSWFPDGKRLAFQSDRTGQMEIWIMHADGSEQKQVSGVPPPPR